jgi:hypothetical protein
MKIDFPLLCKVIFKQKNGCNSEGSTFTTDRWRTHNQSRLFLMPGTIRSVSQNLRKQEKIQKEPFHDNCHNLGQPISTTTPPPQQVPLHFRQHME